LKEKIWQANPNEFPKSELIFQTSDSWNLKLGLNQEVQFQNKLILKVEIEKKNQFKKIIKVKN